MAICHSCSDGIIDGMVSGGRKGNLMSEKESADGTGEVIPVHVPVLCAHEGRQYPGLDRCADCGQKL